MRITLVHAGALGDTLLLAPLLRALRRCSDPLLTVVTRPDFGRLLAHLGLVDRCYSSDDPVHTAWFGSDRSAAAPPWANCDLLISAVSNGQDTWAAHARAALAARGMPGRLCCFEPRPPAGGAEHVVEFHQRQLATQGLALPLACEVPGDAGDGCACSSRQASGPLYIHPGSGGLDKCWPLERFLTLAELCRAADPASMPTFILGEAELERWSRDAARRAALAELQVRFPILQQPDLCLLADRLGAASGYVGNDSGVTHLAALVGAPTWALFGPSNDIQWKPLGPRVRVIRAPLRADMASLSVDRVWQEFPQRSQRPSVS